MHRTIAAAAVTCGVLLMTATASAIVYGQPGRR